MAKAGDQPIVGNNSPGGTTGGGSPEVSPGPFIDIYVPEEIGPGASITVTEVTAFSGFIEVSTGTSVDPGNPAFRVFRGDYTTPGEENDIPVQLTPANSNTADLNWWASMGDSRLTISAINTQADFSYKWAYRFN